MNPLCAKCHVEMEQKSGPYGPFWGCPNYPDCKFVIKIIDPKMPNESENKFEIKGDNVNARMNSLNNACNIISAKIQSGKYSETDIEDWESLAGQMFGYNMKG